MNKVKVVGTYLNPQQCKQFQKKNTRRPGRVSVESFKNILSAILRK